MATTVQPAAVPSPIAATAEGSFWSRNLRFLQDHASEASCEAIADARATPGEWRLGIDRDRRGNLQYRPLGPNGPTAPLHSARDPYGEARRQVERWLERNPIAPGRVVVVFGIAAAFHLHALADLLGETNAMLVVDANPHVVADVLHHADIASLATTRAKMLRFVIGSDSERVLSEFYSTLAQWPRLDYSFFLHPGTVRAFADVYNPLAHRFTEKIRVDVVHRATVINLTRGWLENAIRNLPFLLESSPLQALQGQFPDTPALVVAAGPTLTESLPLLRRLRERAIVIAVGTAYRPLRAAGIDPHLTVLVDGSPIIAKQFEDVAPDAGRLVVPPQIHPSVVAPFAGRLVSWQSGALPEFRDWLADSGLAETGSLGAGGTVTYSAIDAARYLGCPRVYTFGLDLAFADDGQTHVGNSMYTGRRVARDGLVPVQGNIRPQVWTTSQFATYIELLAELAAEFAKRPDCQLLNVNPDGARIPNMRHCLPGEIDPDAFGPVPPVASRLDALCSRVLGEKESLLTLLDQTATELDTLSTHARAASRLCGDLASDGDSSRQDKWLIELREAEAALGATTPAGLLLSAAVRASSLSAIAFCAGIDETDETGFVRVHEKCRDYYGELAEMIHWLRGELDGTRHQLVGG
jgi:hypothetical protein